MKAQHQVAGPSGFHFPLTRHGGRAAGDKQRHDMPIRPSPSAIPRPVSQPESTTMSCRLRLRSSKTPWAARCTQEAARFREQIATRDLDYRGLAVSLYYTLIGPAREQLRGKAGAAQSSERLGD